MEPKMDAFWGDRNGKVKDPFGHCWGIASQKWILTEDEMQERMQEWLKSISSIRDRKFSILSFYPY